MAATIRVKTDRGEEYLDLDEFEARVAKGLIAPQCPVQFAPVTGEAWVPAGSLEVFKQRYSRRELRFSSSFKLGGVPRATLAVCLINILWYALIQLHPIGSTDDTLIAYGAKAGPLLLDLGQFWRLITANLVHRGLLHIGMNLFILFNFAGALENAFGAWDMALVLFTSAVGTTVLSAVVTDPISAGASGIAYGALGAAIVFGMKYRSLLPERYRRVLGGAVVPTVLVFFYVGLTSTGVDNWGHLGGFIAGSLTMLFLKPRLLADQDDNVVRRRVIPILGSLVLVVLLGPLTRPFLPRMARHVDDDLGLALTLPEEWESGVSAIGGHTYLNGLPGYAEARIAVAGFLADSPPDLSAQLDELVRKWLWEPETDEKLQIHDLGKPLQVSLAGGRLTGLERRAIFSHAGIDYDFHAVAVTRGRLVYLIGAVSSREEPGYGRLLDRAIAELEPTEPSFLREARGMRLFFPKSKDAKAGYEAAMAAAGERGHE